MFEVVEKLLHRRFLPKHTPLEPRPLAGTHVAILATDGFEQSELFLPKVALERAGAVTHVISLQKGKIKGWNHTNWGKTIEVDMTVREAWSMEFDFLLLPGGVINPDKLRENAEAVAFAMSFVNKHRPIAAICHGPQLLIETGGLKGRTLTSYPSIKTDIENAGGHWINEKVVIDHRFITSQRPSDIPAFNDAMIQEFAEHKIRHILPDTEGYASTL
ncbi:type 1 glutamine amidotransferase domain-containing protein [Peredibacter sp. HCB2-198]|uniref:type 1 glutamine amidotransferase domain-containing protein n=1 Tax=Peredibacter sp. HCB2-198 TaxID=3383025 RepID=UPI0038B510CB